MGEGWVNPWVGLGRIFFADFVGWVVWVGFNDTAMVGSDDCVLLFLARNLARIGRLKHFIDQLP